MSRGVEKTALQAASLFGLILCVLTGIWAWQAGLLTSQERLQAFVASCGLSSAASMIRPPSMLELVSRMYPFS